MHIFNKNFPDIILHPLTAPNLTPKEHTQALIASIAIGILTIGITHLICALFFAKRKVIPNPPNTPYTPPIAPPPSHRTGFDKQIADTMGAHISKTQRNELLACYDMAIQAPNQRQAFANEVKNRINTPNGWGQQKADHIINNLASYFTGYINPQQPPANPQLAQVQQIASSGCAAFYKTGPTEFLGNFSHAPIVLWGHNFLCVEAAFQWKKYELAANNHAALNNDPLRNQFFTANGEQAFKLNQQLTKKYPGVFANGWKNGVRDQVMWEALQAKFQQNPSQAALLKATGTAYLLEHNEAKRDNYWSDNEDGTGLNILGQMLMAIRDGLSCPAVNNQDPRMQQHTQSIRQKIASNSLGYKIF